MAIRTSTSKVESKQKQQLDMYASLEKEGLPEPVKAVPTLISDQPRVKNVIRWLSKRNLDSVDGNELSVDTVNAYLTNMINQGYKLFNTHYIGENPEGFGVLYILVLE